MINKTCSTCGETKAVDLFVKNKGCRYGHANLCKRCFNKYNSDRRRGNTKYLAERRADYAKRYGPINRAKEQKRKQEHPLRVRCQILRSGMRNRSRELGLPFNSDVLTVDYLMRRLSQSSLCECCGKKLDLSFKSNGEKNNNSPSIDRFFPENGYTEANIRILCWRCNNLKRDATSSELRGIADWIDGNGLGGNELVVAQ